MNHPISNDELLMQLAHFARGHGGRLYGGFTPEQLQDYLMFHAAQRTLSFCRENNAVTGLGVAWQMPAAEIRRRAQYRRAMFDWTATEEGADGLFIANVIALNIGARRALIGGLMKRFPGWAGLQIYTTRKAPHRLKQIKPLALARLVYGHEPLKMKEQLWM